MANMTPRSVVRQSFGRSRGQPVNQRAIVGTADNPSPQPYFQDQTAQRTMAQLRNPGPGETPDYTEINRRLNAGQYDAPASSPGTGEEPDYGAINAAANRTALTPSFRPQPQAAPRPQQKESASPLTGDSGPGNPVTGGSVDLKPRNTIIRGGGPLPAGDVNQANTIVPGGGAIPTKDAVDTRNTIIRGGGPLPKDQGPNPFSRLGSTLPKGQDAMDADNQGHIGGSGLFSRRFSNPRSAGIYTDFVSKLFSGDQQTMA
jgi:hypothetical protein